MEETQLDFSNIMLKRKNEFPQYIELQTQSSCNGNCIICPYKKISNIFPYAKMDDKTIESVIQQCDDNKEKIKRIIPYFNNEPSLDKRIIDILRRIKKKKHFIELSSNLSGFSIKDLDTILYENLVDEFRISIFGGNLEDYHKMMPGLNFNSTIEKVKHLENYNHGIDIKIIIILSSIIDPKKNIQQLRSMFSKIEVLPFGFLDRAGNVDVEKNIVKSLDSPDILPFGCSLNRPFERINILADGKVVLCSQDWNREVNIGDITKEKIKKIWNGEKMENERKKIIGQEKMEQNYICKKCKLLIIRNQINKKISLNFFGDNYMTDRDEIKREYL